MMPSYDPRAIANEFLKSSGGSVSQMKLQKLVFFAHGWNLAINRSPLVDGRIEAWDGGPVFRAIWNHFRDFGLNYKGSLMGDESGQPICANLSQSERGVVEHVWKRYGGYTGLELSNMTHEPGTPWSNAYFGRGRNSVLSQSDIHSHFVELALAGRTAAA
jgi:uncharacterized phage-associated protein